MEENDVSAGWAPTRPLYFSQDPEDTEVLQENTRKALENLGSAARKEGRDPSALMTFRPLTPGVGHAGGLLLAVPAAFAWVHGLTARRSPAP
jgi:hypothetical protein